MDIAHKQFLENENKESLINRILELESYIEIKKTEETILRTQLTEKLFIIETFLKVIKYQNKEKDNEQNWHERKRR